MKILAPKEVERARKEEEAVKVHKLARTEAALSKETLALNISRDIAKANKEALEKEFASFSLDIAGKKKALLEEVEELERRKTDALAPIELLEVEAKKKFSEATELKEEVEAMKRDLLEAKNKVSDEQEAVRVKSEGLAAWQDALKVEQVSATSLQEAAEQEQAKAKKAWADFRAKSLKREKEIEKETADLNLLKSEVATGMDLNEKQKKENEAWKIKLDDRQKTLEDGFKELRELKQKHV
jgi:hypothetical protein